LLAVLEQEVGRKDISDLITPSDSKLSEKLHLPSDVKLCLPAHTQGSSAVSNAGTILYLICIIIFLFDRYFMYSLEDISLTSIKNAFTGMDIPSSSSGLTLLRLRMWMQEPLDRYIRTYISNHISSNNWLIFRSILMVECVSWLK
jgi:hypothetical protein